MFLMPKLDITHKISRIQARIVQLELGDALEARDINALLTKDQQQQLKTTWTAQQALRKTHKTKASAEADGLIWKTIREVRLDIYKQACAQLESELLDSMTSLAAQSEIRAARVFMKAWATSKKNGENAWAQGNNALRRAGLNRLDQLTGRGSSKRDEDLRKIEDELRKKLTD